MGDRILKTYAPKGAPRIWASATEIFLEFDGPGDNCTILHFSRNGLGLSKMIDFIGEKPVKPTDFSLPPSSVNRIKSMSPTTQAIGESILAKLGVLKTGG